MTIVPFGGLRPVAGTHPIVDYLLGLVAKPRAKVCFVPTARGDSPETLLAMYQRFPGARAERTHLELFHRTVKDIRALLLEQDIVYVAGGNTANLLAVWRAHGVDEAMRAAWENGVILTGGSARSLCWYDCGTTDSFDLNELKPLNDGLGFLSGSHCPHYDGELGRRPLYHSLIASGFPPGIAIDDDAAVRYEGTEIAEVVSARAGATAYRVEKIDGDVVETPLHATSLS